MIQAWPRVPLGELIEHVPRPVSVDPSRTYREIGIRSHGKGIFHKEPLPGSALGKKKVYFVAPGDFVLNIVFAWEGAVAVVADSERGMIGSHRFPCFRPRDHRVHTRYLLHYFRTEEGLEILKRVSPGGAGRNRTLSRKEFLRSPIPLPAPEVQARMVADVDSISQRIASALKLGEAAQQEAEDLVVACHLRAAAGRTVVFGDAFVLHEDAVPISDSEDYPLVGVRGFGRGLFTKDAISGADTSYRTFNRLYEGALVISQVKGWEGAAAVVRSEMAGKFVSPEYRTFRCRPDEVEWRYIAHLVTAPWFRRLLVCATHGAGGRRERTRPEKLAPLLVEMPPVDEQRRLLGVYDRLGEVRMLTEQAIELGAGVPLAVLMREMRGPELGTPIMNSGSGPTSPRPTNSSSTRSWSRPRRTTR